MDASALKKAALCSHANPFVLPVLTEVYPAFALSFQEFGSKAIVLRDLEPTCHEMGPIFDYLAHGAAVGFARDCTGKNWLLS